MPLKTVVKRAEDFIRQVLSGDSSGHDWWHIERVRTTAVTIARGEGADQVIVELGALLHDVADWKFAGGDETAGPRRAREWLEAEGVPAKIVDAVCLIVAEVSFKGAGVATPMSSLEGRCVQDADRLDAIGAIGVARAFAYGGHKGRAMHDPTVKAEEHASFSAYKKGDGPTINHFHEKLLLLKDRMNTATGRTLAEGRHGFMVQYLEQFHAEWDGLR